MSRLTQSLEREGLLERVRNSEDRRYLHLCLTEERLRFLQDRKAWVNEELGRRLERLGDEELKELERMLSIVAEGMRL